MYVSSVVSPAGLAMLAKDSRPKIPGEEALWHYKRGAARVLLRKRDEALADLKLAQVEGAAGWVQGRAHLEMARLALAHGDRAGARASALQAVTICERSHDPICVEEAKRIR